MNPLRKRRLIKKFNIIRLPNDKFGEGVLFGLSHAEEYYDNLYKRIIKDHNNRLKKLEKSLKTK